METVKTLEFGKKYRVGNFAVIKFNKTLKKQEVAQLRNQMGIPEQLRKQLQRAQLPYIKIEAISGIWAIEYCCGSVVYNMLDTLLPKAFEAEAHGIKLEADSVADFAHLFAMLYTDTCVIGDSIYQADKAKALNALIARQQAFEAGQESPEEKLEDDKELRELKENQEHKAKIIDMAATFRKEAQDE